jgi:hypothetical protein
MDEARQAARQREVGGDPREFSEGPEGERARERWARRHDDLNGAPEGEWDR